jgi:hypothetical protein
MCDGRAISILNPYLVVYRPVEVRREIRGVEESLRRRSTVT